MTSLFELKKGNKNVPVLNEIKSVKMNYNEVYEFRTKLVEIINKLTNINESFVEHAYIATFDCSGNLTGICHISMGSNDECEFYTKTILSFLVMLSADSFVLIHNHPSGSVEPSEEDINNYESTKEIFSSFDYEVIDSMIIADKKWYSIENEEEGVE